jgi:hypothetical protein
MNQTQMGTSFGFPKFKNVFAVSKKKNDAKSSRLSSAVVMFSSMLMLALQLLAGSANAVNIPVTSFTCTQAMTATTTCVGSGDYASGWFTPGTGYWQYVLNTVGYSGTIAMTFSNTKSSAAGPTTGQVYYNIGAGDVAVGTAFTVTTSCVSQSVTLPAVCTGVSGLIVKVKMTGATANTATHRISAVNVFDAASSTCTTTPTVAGTVSAASNPVCAGSSTALTLTGATAGSGITYQWQSSPNNSTWTNISGATSLSYTATPSAATYYRVVTTCSTTGGSISSPSLLVNVTTVTVAPITGLTSSQLTVGDVVPLSDATTGGVWSSSNTSAVTIDATGHLSANFGGSSVISYKVTSAGCVGTSTANVTVIWPNTLALYAGVNGNSTGVINVPNDAVSSLSAVGFGTNTPCTSGGFSGITVNLADSVLNTDSAHIGYKVYANSGYSLNFFRIHARARVSGTGPKKARIGYRYWIAGSLSPWIVEATDVTLVSGTCGNSANSWDFNSGNPSNPNPNVNGADSMEVAVFPFAPDTTTGTFQLNSLEVYGIVTTNANCNVVMTTADSALPSIVNLCDSGSYFLNYNIGSGGIAGPGIEYQWQVSTTSPTSGYTDIADANGVVYQTPFINASSPIDTFYYRVEVICDFSGLVAFSEPSLVTIHSTPANAGTITGGLASTVLPSGHMLIGAPTYTLSSTVSGGTWTSNDTSTISIVPATGVATPHIQGDAVITYSKIVNGCYSSSKATYFSYHNGTKALYVGTGGNSLNVYAVAGATGTTATNFTLTNWDSTQACQSGGRAGLVNTTTVQDQTTNGSVVTRVAAAASGSFTASNIIATLRDPATGTYLAYLGYKAVGSTTWTVSSPVSVDFDDCGYSHNEINFPVSVAVGTAGVDFAVFGYNGSTTTGLQVNSLSVIGTGAALMKGAGVANMDIANNIQLYPNPAENTLNVNAPQAVNVVIMSIDGKKLLEQKNAISVNVSSLMSGMYLIQVYDESNKTLLKTEKFIKK